MSRLREHHHTVPRTSSPATGVRWIAFSVVIFLLTLASSELEQLRTQTQTAQSESATAASQTAAMMSLNLKLQSTASKNQARMIELEVKKQEAREARELLSIVQVSIQSCF